MSKKSSTFAAAKVLIQNKDNMKKYLVLSILAIALASFNSCTYNEAEECKFHSKGIYLSVNQNEWKYDENSYQFYAHFSVPELTSNVYNYGNYSFHRVYNTYTDDEYQVGLPQSIYMIENVPDGQGNVLEYYYTQSVDYRVGVGFVEIQVTNSDYLYPQDAQGHLIAPEKMDFHLQLIW